MSSLFGKWLHAVSLILTFASLSLGESSNFNTTKSALLPSGVIPRDLKAYVDERIKQVVQKTMLPVGFIYVQLPKTKPPHVLWPSVTWKEVSFDYAGVFFRVVGGQAGSFGKIQGSSIPRITEVENVHIPKWREGKGIVEGKLKIPRSGWSEAIYSGDYYKYYTENYGLKFYRTHREIRPRNMAIRIWKRA